MLYETVKTRAISSPASSRTTLVPARAVYAIGRPPSVIECCVTDGAGSAASAGRAAASAEQTNSDASATAANLRIFTESRFVAS
jgi:hypothetical protein